MELSHTDPNGKANMVDVSAKPVVKRTATATATVKMQPGTLQLIRDNGLKKGDILAVARIAGIQAAKQTSLLIPLCHSLPLSHVAVDFELLEASIRITTSATTQATTGVEMEALTAASVAALTLYDMAKAVDKSMVLTDVTLLSKTKEEAPTPLPPPHVGQG
jgi:cyclic pyranopterin phosphate synthase